MIGFLLRFGALVFLVIGGALAAQGQTQSQTQAVSGRAVDGATREPLIGATVLLVHLPDSARRGTTADVAGNFRFAQVPAGAYRLTISFLGYQTVRQRLTVAGQPVVLGAVAVPAAAVQLTTTTVTGRTPPVVQRGDTAQFNANAFKTNVDADARDLLTKMPGVTVGADGKVQAQGEAVQRVLVDGKEFFGDDPDAVLRNLPAEAIDKVQIFDRQSEQSQFSGFDDGNTVKTINIVTKPQFRSGQFGRVAVGAGPDRYRASANLNSFEGDRRVSVVAQTNNVNEQNFSSDDLLGVVGAAQTGGGGRGGRGGGRSGGGGDSNVGNFLVNQRGGITTTHAAGVNFADKFGTQTEVQGAYFFNHATNVARAELARQFVLPQVVGQRYAETSDRDSRNQNHRLSMRIEHKLDSNNSFLFRPRASVQLNRTDSRLVGQTFRSDTLLTQTVRSDYAADLTGWNLGGELLYRHRFARKGRTLSLSATPSYNARSGPSNLLADTSARSAEAPRYYALDQRADLTQAGWGIGANLDYTEPLTARSQVQGSYTFSYAPNESDKQTFDLDTIIGAYTRRNEPLSNVFSNRYTTHGAGVSYRYHDRRTQFNVGLTGQRAALNGTQTFPRATEVNRTFYRLLPTAQLRLKLSADKNLRVNYRARTNAPGIGQLQEVLDNANPLQLSTGNPALEQETQHNVFVRYTAAQPARQTSFFALMGGSVTRDYITNQTTVAVTETVVSPTLTLPAGAQLTRPVNLNGYYTLRSFATYGLPLAFLKSNLNLNASATFSRMPGLVNGGLNYARTPAVGGGLTLSSNISERLDFAVTSNTSFTRVSNTLRTTANNQYLNQATSLRLSWLVGPGISVKTDVSHQLFSGLSAGFDQSYVLWNASIGKKIFANQRGEIQLYVYDLLGQNQAIERTITEAYLQDQRTTVLQRYAMVMFTYNLRRGTGAPAPSTDGDRGRGERPNFRPEGGPGGPPPGN